MAERRISLSGGFIKREQSENLGLSRNRNQFSVSRIPASSEKSFFSKDEEQLSRQRLALHVFIFYPAKWKTGFHLFAR
jgi:hypothetical protein